MAAAEPVKQHGPGYATPLEAFTTGPREELIYVPAVYTSTGIDKPDYLATVDVDEKSDTYCQVIHRLELGVGDELHHSGWDSCSSCHGDPTAKRRHLVLPALASGNIYFVSTEDLRAPVLKKCVTGEEIKEKAGCTWPHSSHCLADGNVMVSMMGDANGEAAGGFVLIDGKSMELKGRWVEDSTAQGYDFWYQPRKNVMVSSEYGNPNKLKGGFNPADVADGHYGNNLYVWDWEKRELKQKIELGGDGLIPLETRFMHEPTSPHGFVGCALSSTIMHFYPDDSGKYVAEKVIQVDNVPVDGWALPEVPGLITDILISLDDKYLYFSNWLQGDVRQYDITDPFHPKLTGQVFLGGVLQEGTPFARTDGKPRPKNAAPKGVYFQGGPQMIQLSLDGRRLYVSSSLFSPWDKQFYPDMTSKGSQMARINIDHENGGMSLDEGFVVDFGSEPNGPALCHEMRYPGGDCSSDIWI